MAEDSLDADPFLAALRLALVAEFTGTAAELLEHVPYPGEGRPPRDWPRNARTITSRLKRNAPALRKAGWTVEDRGNANHDGVTVWHLQPAADPTDRPEIARNPSPPSPHARTNGTKRGEAGNAGNEYAPSQDGVTQCADWKTCPNGNCQTFATCVEAV